jgi:hypothetical protein
MSESMASKESPPPYCGRDPLAYAYDAQHIIGWGRFLEGSLSKLGLTVQATYLLSVGSRKTASVWARGLIHQPALESGFSSLVALQLLAT